MAQREIKARNGNTKCPNNSSQLHAAAVGFIEIFGLPLRVEAARHGAVGKHHGAAWAWTPPLLADLPTTVEGPEGASPA